MEEDRRLYPFKLLPIEENPSESIQIADLGYADSVVRNGWLAASTLSEVMDMYMDRVVGEEAFAAYGRQFPILVKFISVGGSRTPLMVCPDDVVAAERFDFLGKTKMWYVLSVGPKARIDIGFDKDVASADFYTACRHGEVGDMLHCVTPKVGDCFLIRPGEVHAAADVTVLEVAESSPLDFRLFDWGGAASLDEFDASLNLEAAFDFINYGGYVGTAESDEDVLADCNAFKVVRMRISDPMRVSGSFDGYVAYTCLSGAFSIQTKSPSGGMDSLQVSARESVIVPSEVNEWYMVPCSSDTEIVEITPGKSEVRDSYLGNRMN